MISKSMTHAERRWRIVIRVILALYIPYFTLIFLFLYIIPLDAHPHWLSILISWFWEHVPGTRNYSNSSYYAGAYVPSVYVLMVIFGVIVAALVSVFGCFEIKWRYGKWTLVLIQVPGLILFFIFFTWFVLFFVNREVPVDHPMIAGNPARFSNDRFGFLTMISLAFYGSFYLIGMLINIAKVSFNGLIKTLWRYCTHE